MMDNLGGRLGSFDRLEKELSPGAAWSGFDRAIGSGAYFGSSTRTDAPSPITAEDRRPSAAA
jgi:3'-5' exoribonuclease